MALPELHRTLVAAVEAVSPPPGSGLAITEIELDLPLELVAATRDGRPAIGGRAPHSRWIAGFLPAVHLARLQIVRIDHPTAVRRGGD